MRGSSHVAATERVRPQTVLASIEAENVETHSPTPVSLRYLVSTATMFPFCARYSDTPMAY
eukprot:5487115-Pleurochrysis_carterae.AAC.3